VSNTLDSDSVTASTKDPHSLAGQGEQLAQAILHWARNAVNTFDPEGNRIANAPGCSACPLCQLIQRLRTEDPQLAAGLSDAITDVAAGLVTALQLVSGALGHFSEPPGKAKAGDDTAR
jgi:hypothetical protein